MTDKTDDARELLRDVLDRLTDAAYKPGEHEGFKHINYCQWCHYSESHGHGDDCMIARITAHLAAPAPEPVEPEQIKMMRYDEPEGRSDYERVVTDYIDSLQSALKLAQEEYQGCRDTLNDERVCHGETVASLKRAASEQIQAAHQRAEKAEATNRRMVELLKEPSEEMWSAVWASIKVPELQRARSVLSVHDLRLLWAAFHKALSAKLINEVEK